eukprot:COSAG06_NODE_23_length_33072_cov_44.622327_21_plen_178_part_00
MKKQGRRRGRASHAGGGSSARQSAPPPPRSLLMHIPFGAAPLPHFWRFVGIAAHPPSSGAICGEVYRYCSLEVYIDIRGRSQLLNTRVAAHSPARSPVRLLAPIACMNTRASVSRLASIAKPSLALGSRCLLVSSGPHLRHRAATNRLVTPALEGVTRRATRHTPQWNSGTVEQWNT